MEQSVLILCVTATSYTMQARHPADSEWVGGRAGIHHAVPDPARAELRVQVHHLWAARHTVVARSHLMASRHRLWPYRHPPQTRRPVSVRSALQGGSPHLWYVNTNHSLKYFLHSRIYKLVSQISLDSYLFRRIYNTYLHTSERKE
jgi:hypothetical protein